MNRLDSIESKLSTLEHTVSSLGQRVADVKHKNQELQQSVSFVSSKFDSERQNLESFSLDLERKFQEQEKLICEVNTQLHALKDSPLNSDAMKRCNTQLKRHSNV
jgi:uncharacterized coiled-coil protein SlyX